jgi:pimeloyl-ACP methyl ester carboxylesterase
LLVHGGGHGGWCWSGVQRYLAGMGIDSTAADLPGSGQDRTPRSQVNLDIYIRAVTTHVDSIESGTEDDVWLVGHSIAGLTLPAVAAARPERITHVVYLAALITGAQQRGIDSIPPDRRPSYFEMAERSSDNSFLPSFEAAWDRFFPSLDEARARECYWRLTPQPLGPYLDPNPVNAQLLDVPSSYVLLEDDRTFPMSVAREFAKQAGVLPVIRSGDHCWMLTDPHACANAIVEVARA